MTRGERATADARAGAYFAVFCAVLEVVGGFQRVGVDLGAKGCREEVEVDHRGGGDGRRDDREGEGLEDFDLALRGFLVVGSTASPRGLSLPRGLSSNGFPGE